MSGMKEGATGLGRRAWTAYLGWPTWKRVALALVLFVVVFGGGRLVVDAIQHSRQQSAAQDACEGYVKESLKSPASAEFSDTQLEKRGEYGYTVTGAVDSQNGFGAMLRNRYECQVNQVGDSWLLIDMNFSGQDN